MKHKNYLFDLYKEYPERLSKIIGLTDPDAESEDLYKDLSKIFFDNKWLDEHKLKNPRVKKTRVKKKSIYSLIFEDCEDCNEKIKYKLSSDYIGASKYWAIEAGMSKDILEYLKISRTIGGHMVFPRGQGTTVNQARGGDESYYDRFDLTLLAIKKWYLNDNSKINDAIENYSDWFKLFYNFKGFIDFFHLNGFVVDVDKDYKIIDLVKSDLVDNKTIILEKEEVTIPKCEESYRRYFDNSNQIILKRTEKLEKILKKTNEYNKKIRGKNE